MWRFIEAALVTLPAPEREAFALVDVEGLPGDEVAKRLGLGLSAVRERLHRARLLMRRALAPYLGETGPVANARRSP